MLFLSCFGRIEAWMQPHDVGRPAPVTQRSLLTFVIFSCKCGGQFCYICGVPWKQCSCLQWDEARLVVRAQEVVEREAPRAMPRFAMENLVENMREELRDNHECTHGGWLTRVDGSIGTTFRCEICSHRHSNFILQCPRCHLHICATCRRNRLR